MAQRQHRIVVIRGDGIGPELIDASLKVMEAAQLRLEDFRLEMDFHEAGAGLYQREGVNLQPETLAAIKAADATFKAPVGLPEVRNPDGTEAGLLGGVLRIAWMRTRTCAPCGSCPASTPRSRRSRGRSTT